jgi:hypothetical protein
MVMPPKPVLKEWPYPYHAQATALSWNAVSFLSASLSSCAAIRLQLELSAVVPV